MSILPRNAMLAQYTLSSYVHPTAHAAGPPALQTTTTDASEQNNTGQLSGPVIIGIFVFISSGHR